MMRFAAWGQQEKVAFNNGGPLEFILQASGELHAGDSVEIKFFNAKGELSKEKGVISLAEPGLIQVKRA